MLTKTKMKILNVCSINLSLANNVGNKGHWNEQDGKTLKHLGKLEEIFCYSSHRENRKLVTSKMFLTDAWFSDAGRATGSGRTLGCLRWVRVFKERHKIVQEVKMTMRMSNFLQGIKK